jgi:hypothetical protein
LYSAIEQDPCQLTVMALPTPAQALIMARLQF